MNTVSFRQVPQNYPIIWIKASMKIGERNWGLFLAIGFFSLFTTLSVGLIPYIGYFFGSLLGFILTLGELRMYKKILNHESVNFETFMNLVFDPLVFKKFQTYLIIVFVIALLETLLLNSGLKFMNLTALVPTFLITLFAFAAFTELDKEVINPSEAIKFVAKGIWNNILATIACSLLVTLFAFVCALACLIPVFLYAMPMLLSVKYLIYASIFENLDADQTLAEWAALTKVNTAPTEPPSL